MATIEPSLSSVHEITDRLGGILRDTKETTDGLETKLQSVLSENKKKASPEKPDRPTGETQLEESILRLCDLAELIHQILISMYERLRL